MRGKRIAVEALAKVYQDGVNLPMSIFSMDILGETIEACGLGLEVGEPDLTCFPINNSLVIASWHKNHKAQLLMSMTEQDDTPFYGEPRNVLESACLRFQQLKLTAVVAVELEFYLFDKVRTHSGNVQAPISPKTKQRDQYTQVYSVDTLAEYADFLDDISRICQEQNVPADTAVAEYAPGQFEINLKHQADPLLDCDNAMLLKRIIKSVADMHNFDCSFMAKPYADEAGSGMHVHVSVLNEQGKNIFADEESEYSEQLEFAIGGLLALLPASMPFLCPNVNSYKRFQPDSYVADSLTWGVDNRTVALRIPKSNKSATRIEHRVAGADANPYLVMSVIINSIHHGLMNRITPIKPFVGNVTKQKTILLPKRVSSGLVALEKDNVLTNMMFEKFTRLYLTAKAHELSKIEAHISDVELDWYLKNV
jgi:glutamine synthetase